MIKVNFSHVWGGKRLGYSNVFQIGEPEWALNSLGQNHYDTSKVKFQLWVLNLNEMWDYFVWRVFCQKRDTLEEAAFWRGVKHGIENAQYLDGLTEQERAELIN
jgi:tRNA(His) 5'-end guanylyltransferase